MSLEPGLDYVSGPCTVVHVTLLRLTVVHDEAEAEVVCGPLRANGIECSYKTDLAAGTWTSGFARGGPRSYS